MKKEFLQIAVAFTVGYIIGKLISSKKGKVELDESSASGENTVQFTIENTGTKAVQVPLFYAMKVVSIENVIASGNLRYFTNSLQARPKQVTSMQIVATNQQQALTPLTFYCKDANGQMSSNTLIPTPPVTQVNPNISYFQPQNMILDGTCALILNLGAGQKVNLIMSYFEYTPETKK